jgi:hypothetical protein
MAPHPKKELKPMDNPTNESRPGRGGLSKHVLLGSIDVLEKTKTDPKTQIKFLAPAFQVIGGRGQ